MIESVGADQRSHRQNTQCDENRAANVLQYRVWIMQHVIQHSVQTKLIGADILLHPEHMANSVIVVDSFSGEKEDWKYQHGCQRSSNNYVCYALFCNCAPSGRGRAKARGREEQ